MSTTDPVPRRSFRRVRSAAAVVCLALFSSVAAQGVADDDAKAREIVEKADLVRFPSGGFEVVVSIVSSAPGKEAQTRKYKVLSKGNENTVVLATEPASERGQILLMKGNDLWIFLPNVSQPVRVPLSQRLTGQVANGDLARANFAGDYTSKLVGTEQVDGEAMYVLELTANSRSVTYHKVMYWVRQSNYWPHRAQFYSLSNRLLKTAHYRNFISLGGRVRPSQLVMQDALREGEESVITYAELRPRDLPDRIFTKDYLKRLE